MQRWYAPYFPSPSLSFLIRPMRVITSPSCLSSWVHVRVRPDSEWEKSALKNRVRLWGMEDGDGQRCCGTSPKTPGSSWEQHSLWSRSEARGGGRAAHGAAQRHAATAPLPFSLLIPCRNKAVWSTKVLGNPRPLECEKRERVWQSEG